MRKGNKVICDVCGTITSETSNDYEWSWIVIQDGSTILFGTNIVEPKKDVHLCKLDCMVTYLNYGS